MLFRHQILNFLSTFLLGISLGNLNVASAATTAPFLGNRTHLAYSSATRNGSATADPLYMTKATGRVLVGFGDLVDGEGEGLDVVGGRGDLIQQWANENGIQVNISSKPRNDDETLIGTQCSKATGDYDLLILDATELGSLQPCLLDLWAWDFGFGEGIDSIILSNGIYKNTLVGLPFEIHHKLLLFNAVYLTAHGYDNPPTIDSLQTLTDMLDDIIVNERGAENYLAQGFAGSLADAEEWVSLCAQWAGGVGSPILQDSPSASINTRKNSLATGNFTSVISYLISWMDKSLVNTDTFSAKLNEVKKDFLDRHVVFMHVDVEEVFGFKDSIEFEWGVTGMPPLDVVENVNLKKGKESLTLSGTFIGVPRNAANPTAAVKLAAYLTGKEYISKVLYNKAYGKTYLYPHYRDLLQDDTICVNLDKLCPVYKRAQTVLRPSTLFTSTPTLYSKNATRLVSDTLVSIFTGGTTVGDGIIDLDNALRILLGWPLSNATLLNDTIAARPRAKFNNLYEQILLLFLFIGCGVTSVIMYKRKTMLEEIEERRRRIAKEMGGNGQAAGVGIRVDETDFSETARLIERKK